MKYIINKEINFIYLSLKNKNVHRNINKIIHIKIKIIIRLYTFKYVLSKCPYSLIVL